MARARGRERASGPTGGRAAGSDEGRGDVTGIRHRAGERERGRGEAAAS